VCCLPHESQATGTEVDIVVPFAPSVSRDLFVCEVCIYIKLPIHTCVVTWSVVNNPLINPNNDKIMSVGNVQQTMCEPLKIEMSCAYVGFEEVDGYVLSK
jgi:hypothetical protein